MVQMTPERLAELRGKVTHVTDDPVRMTKAERISNALSFGWEPWLAEALDEVERLQEQANRRCECGQLVNEPLNVLCGNCA